MRHIVVPLRYYVQYLDRLSEIRFTEYRETTMGKQGAIASFHVQRQRLQALGIQVNLYAIYYFSGKQ
jgi:hypothetical protein